MEMTHEFATLPYSRAMISGCGDIGLRIARMFALRKVECSALARSLGSAARMRAAGVTPVDGDLDMPESLRGLDTAGTPVFHLAPPPNAGESDPRTAALLSALSADEPPSVLVYASTSGVYGDCQGAWVDEHAPLRPGSDRARRRVDAEERIRAWSAETGVRAVILRVPGIYGPGRLPLERVRAGSPVLDPAQSGWTNRIHADDLARLFVAASALPVHGAFNVSDGTPGTPSDIPILLSEILGLPRPPLVSWDDAVTGALSPMELSFFRESRRLDITRMRDALPLPLLHPDLREGLTSSLEASA